MGGLISGLFGGGQSDFKAQQAQLTNPVTQSTVNSYGQQVDQGLTGLQAQVQQAGAQNGYGNQTQVFGQQQQLAQQLQAQTMGQGPNPAQAQFAQNTGQNVQQQAALMAGQRGAGANAGLIARQAALAGTNAQQQATGQAATLQAQQQLAAQQQLGQQQQAMQGVAAQQVGQSQTAAQMYAGAGQNAYSTALSGNLTGQGQQIQNAQQANSANAQVQSANSQASSGMVGGLLNGIGGGLAKKFLGAEGGEVPGRGQAFNPGGPARTQMFARGGKVPGGAMSHVGMYCKGGLMASGGAVPGQASKAGNSYSNDTVPAMLSPGEIVIPRSITQGKDPAANAAKFVQAIMARKQRGGK